MFSRAVKPTEARQQQHRQQHDGTIITVPATTTAQATAGWVLTSVSSVFSRVKVKVEETISPRVVQPSSDRPAKRKSWSSSSGVITAATLTRECHRSSVLAAVHFSFFPCFCLLLLY